MTVSCQLSCGHSCCLVPPLNPPQPFFFSSSSFSAFFTILSIPILHLSLSQSHSSHSQSHSCKYPILISSRTYLHNRVSEMARRGKYPASIFLSEGERVEERKKLENSSVSSLLYLSLSFLLSHNPGGLLLTCDLREYCLASSLTVSLVCFLGLSPKRRHLTSRDLGSDMVQSAKGWWRGGVT